MSESGLVTQLQQLSELHRQGAITDAEYASAKQQLLSGGGPRSGRPNPLAAPRGHAPNTGLRKPAQSQARAGQAPPPTSYMPSGYSAPTNPPMNPIAAERPSVTERLAGHTGAVMSAVAGVVVLLSFLVLPMATVPFLGSISGSGVAGESSLFGPFGLLWLVPVQALAIMGIATGQIVARPAREARRARALGVIVLAGGVWATYAGVLVSLQAQVSELSSRLSISAFLGAGLWFALVAAAVAALGGLIEMTAGR